MLVEEEFHQTHNALEIALLGELDEDREDLLRSYTKVEDTLEQSRNFILYIIFFVFVFTVSIGYFISHSISEPIKNLSQIVQAITGGDLTKRAEVKSKNEIGQLAKNFNLMTDKLVQALQRQKEYATERLAKVTPILQKISMGDFSKNVEVPQREDEFTEHLVALSLMIDDLKEIEKVQKEAEEARIAVVTERAKAEEAKKTEAVLRAEKNKLQKYLDIAGAVILILDLGQKVLLINKKGSEILRHKTGRKIIGKNWINNFVPEKNRTQVKTNFEKLISGKTDQVKYYEYPILAKNGEEKIISWQQSILNDEKGQPQAVLGVGIDITELKQARVNIKQLEELNKMKDDFLNIATHELRTPLTSIVGLSEIMSNQKPSLSSANQKYVNIIHGEGTKLAHIIERILTVTRFESGKETVYLEPFNLTTFVSSLQPSLDIIAKKKNSKIITDIEKKNIVVRSDKEKISQVIYNLIDNAVKYGPEGQTITISITKPEKDWVKVEVTDQGPGISLELQEKLFTKFSQLEPSLIRSQEGTGLGLYICRLIVDKLRGKIGVKSELGKGSTFYFALPIRKKSNNPK